MENKISMVAKFPKHIRPLADRIIIYRDQGDDTFGGRGIIHVPDNKKFKKTKGTVVAVGNGKYFKDMEVAMELNPGDRVVYNKYTGVEVYFNIAGVST